MLSPIIIITCFLFLVTAGPVTSHSSLHQRDPSPNPAKQKAPKKANKFQTTALNHHNIHRANHSATNLVWDDQIASYAAEVGATCVFQHQGIEGRNIGQNLAMIIPPGGASSVPSNQVMGQAVSDMWYNGEIAMYPAFGAEPSMSDFENWGHFSQLVWKQTTSVGCAVQYCPKGTMNSEADAWFMVCNYSPAGNMAGYYGSNVGQPLGKAVVGGIDF